VFENLPWNIEWFVGPQLESSKLLAEGMLNPSPEDLHPGNNMYLYRIGHSKFPPRNGEELTEEQTREANYTSPWWMNFDTWNSIRQLSLRRDAPLSTTHRVRNAVPMEFGPADILVKVRLRKFIKVFRGLGDTIYLKGTEKFFVAPDDVTQMFIPGLRRPRSNYAKSALWDEIFSEASYEKI